MASRMILVPEALFERFREKQVKPKQSSFIPKSLSNRDKAKLLIQENLRFKNRKTDRRKRILQIPIETNEKELEEEEEDVKEELRSAAKPTLVQAIREIVPEKAYRRALLLVKHLKQYPSMIRWTPLGELYINDELIPNVNFLDLIRFAAVVKKVPQGGIRGLGEFIQVLKDSGTPTSFIPNRYLKELVEEEEEPLVPENWDSFY